MCETEGYVPSTSAGKDIKCANPKCMVPVFTAPAPEPEPVAAPKPAKKAGNPVLLGVITLVVVGGIGIGAYFFSTRPTNEVFVKPIDPGTVVKNTRPVETPTNTTLPVTPTEVNTPPEAQASNSSDGDRKLIAEILKDCQQTSLLSGSRNRSKPYCRRLAAEAFAFSGDLNGARQQIEALAIVGPELTFYQVLPWLDVFAQERTAGNAEAAATALNAAVKAAEKLPSRGRDQLDIATRLAVALVLSDRIDEARTLITAHQTTDLDGEVSPEFLWLAADPKLVTTDAVFHLRPIVARQTPQAAAVAALSSFQGDHAQGLKYAQGWDDANIRAECLSAWAEGVVWNLPGEATTLIETAISDLPAPAKSLVLTRAARVAGSRQQKELGQSLLAKGTAVLEELAPPQAVILPETKELVKNRPDFDPLWQRAAMAAAELSVTHWLLTGDQNVSTRWLNRSLEYARGLGPALPAIAALVADADRMGPTILRSRLKSELNLRTDDDARQTMGVYRRTLTDYETGARIRFGLQTMILSRAAQAGLEEAVWTIANGQHLLEEDSEREEFLATDVAVWLAERFQETKNSAALQALTAARSQSGLKELPRPPASIYAELMAASKATEAWNVLNQSGVKSDLREAVVLQTAVKLGLSDAPLDAAWKAMAPITDVVLREQAIEWVSLMAARRGKAAEVWKRRSEISSATESLSLAKGLVQGIEDRRRASADNQKVTATESAKP